MSETSTESNTTLGGEYHVARRFILIFPTIQIHADIGQFPEPDIAASIFAPSVSISILAGHMGPSSIAIDESVSQAPAPVTYAGEWDYQ
jgi:hypothetical protein